MLIPFGTAEAVSNEYRNDLIVCAVLAVIFFLAGFLPKWVGNRRNWKWSLFGSSLFMLVAWLCVRACTIGNFIEAEITESSVTLRYADAAEPLVLDRSQILDITVGHGGKHWQSCNLIVVPKEGWHYTSPWIWVGSTCNRCDTYRNQALAILKLPIENANTHKSCDKT